MGLIEGGCIPFPALEGHWGSRLKVIQDIPRGKTMWMVDQTDMAKAKETFGKNACLIGNVPSSMLKLGTPQDVKDYCQETHRYGRQRRWFHHEQWCIFR